MPTTLPTTALAEAIERDSLADMVAACPAPLRERFGFEAVEAGGGTAFVCRDAGPVINRAIGAGTSAAELAEVVAVYRERGVERFFVHAYGGPELDTAAAAAGLARYGRSWVKLLRGSGAVPDLGGDHEIGPASGALEGEAAGRLFAAGFDLAPAFAGVIAALVDRPGWDVLVARDAGAVIAVGLLYVRDGVAHLAGGATDPAHRGRGAQGALIAERVRRAIAAGCRFVTSETGEQVPGDPQHSYRNMVRCGFEVIATRANLVPPAMSSSHGRTPT